jgi:hypothetical protein
MSTSLCDERGGSEKGGVEMGHRRVDGMAEDMRKTRRQRFENPNHRATSQGKNSQLIANFFLTRIHILNQEM